MNDPSNVSLSTNITTNYLNNILPLNTHIVISLGVLLLFIIVVCVFLGGSAGILTFIIIFIVIVLLLVNGLRYLFGIDVMTSFSGITSEPELDIVVDTTHVSPVPQVVSLPQVFNISGNTHSYEDAKAVCSAFGSRLATYEEVENAYNSGGEWCNYGWSDGQMALFPTQKRTYDELQKIKGHEHDCGRPGVNGGYMANPKLKFGVNCFGLKPKMTDVEEELMATEPLYPRTMKDVMLEKRVNYWKNNLSELLVSPFNHTSWSKI